jgi:NitT/TauT family transport system ATP-binding protein
MIAGDRVVLESEGLYHAFGSNRVLHDIKLRIVQGEIVALVGPSGCGKSTFLRMILGTLQPNRGQVTVYTSRDGERVGSVVHKPGRDRGIVYQRYSLFPHLTALDNVAFGLMLDKTSIPQRTFHPLRWRALRKKQRQASSELLEKLGLGHALKNYPHELSGGMRQRVAIAQALILKPAILLLDEPFGALDEATREELQRMLLGLYSENVDAVRQGQEPPYTILMVTHELNEAIFVSDRILGLSQYWDWKRQGHDAFPGATIVYDHHAPVFNPDDEREYHQFQEQKDEILRSTFNPEVLQEREEWNKFWDHVKSGQAKGIHAPPSD